MFARRKQLLTKGVRTGSFDFMCDQAEYTLPRFFNFSHGPVSENPSKRLKLSKFAKFESERYGPAKSQNVIDVAKCYRRLYGGGTNFPPPPPTIQTSTFATLWCISSLVSDISLSNSASLLILGRFY